MADCGEEREVNGKTACSTPDLKDYVCVSSSSDDVEDINKAKGDAQDKDGTTCVLENKNSVNEENRTCPSNEIKDDTHEADAAVELPDKR